MKKVVLITGAGKGIGKETALAFARAGFIVAACGRTASDLK
ncbi:MAG: SDR family NAD(P)-dependent oxidoreductase, partial [Candidatus Dadabacteria bacterium]|nr:SDR family NAD(P)-dependent oxidoreductase [Candidatus Dadabacteria bacterium]